MENNAKFHLVPFTLIILSILFNWFGGNSKSVSKTNLKKKSSLTKVAKKIKKNDKEWWDQQLNKTIKQSKIVSNSPENSVLSAIDYSKNNDTINFLSLFDVPKITETLFSNYWTSLSTVEKENSYNIIKKVILKNINNAIESSKQYKIKVLPSDNANLALVKIDYTVGSVELSKIVKLNKVNGFWAIVNFPGITEIR